MSAFKCLVCGNVCYDFNICNNCCEEVPKIYEENKRLRAALGDLRHGIFASEQAVNDCIDKALEGKDNA